MANTTTFEQTLKQAGYSNTLPRRLVFDALTAQDSLSIGALCEVLSGNVDRSSIYRTVDLFEKLGIVRRLHHGWKFTIELSDAFSHHHHHATCSSCNHVFEFEESAGLEEDIRRLAADLGIQLQSHSLELRGICKRCQNIV